MRKLDNLYALYELGRRLGALRSLLKVKKEMDGEIGTQCLECVKGLEYIIRGEAVSLPRSRESASVLLVSIMNLLNGEAGIGRQEYGAFLDAYFTGPIKANIDTFQIALSEELKLSPLFSVEDKGNLSIVRLVDGASSGYPAIQSSFWMISLSKR